MDKEEIDRILAHLQDERNGVALYNTLADLEKDTRLAEVYRRMAAAEQRHAQAWVERLKESGVEAPLPGLAWRTRTLIWLARRFGTGLVLPSVMEAEQKDSSSYSKRSDAAQMAVDEGSHARLLQRIVKGTGAGLEGSAVAQLEGRHRAAGGNALRAAVLGANDGLVSNFSLVMGVAGAELAGKTILITGLAGLLAGAISMALGEWLSVQSSRELYQHQINIEREEIARAPEEEAEELSLIYQARGIGEEQARSLANQIMSDQENALETLAREELSVDPAELGGSAWEAATASFVLFAIGAIAPVIPYAFLSGLTAVIVSAVLSTLGLFVIGSAITLYTGRGVLFSGARQVVFGLLAAAVTYGIGRLIGASIGG
jgi:VIT1/CCC1 family predicted Fe2+/Mn2+ transporter